MLLSPIPGPEAAGLDEAWIKILRGAGFLPTFGSISSYLNAAVATSALSVDSEGNLTTVANFTVSGNTQLNGILNVNGIITGSNLTGTNSGDITLNPVGSSPNADGASLSVQSLTLQPANASFPGLLTAGAQTIGGAKTFSGSVFLPSLSAYANTDSVVTTDVSSGLLKKAPFSTFGSSVSPPYTVYVSPSGSDSNNGLSWSSPKLTIMGGYDAIVEMSQGLGGTIYVYGFPGSPLFQPVYAQDQTGTKLGDVTNGWGGIWVMGDFTDPSYKTFSGTITPSSPTITGTGFTSVPVNVGDRLFLPGDTVYGGRLVQAVTNTQITLSTSYGGSDTGNQTLNRMPVGWRLQVPVELVGNGVGKVGFFGEPTQAWVYAGSRTNRAYPAVWMSGAGLSMKNLFFGYPAVFMRLGIGTDYNFVDAITGPAQTTFTQVQSEGVFCYNVAATLNSVAGTGPCIEGSQGCIFTNWDNCQFSGNELAGRHSDMRAVWRWYSSGDFRITNCRCAGAGGIKYQPGTGIFGGVVDGLIFESDFVTPPAPPFWAQNLSIFGSVNLSNITAADGGTSTNLNGTVALINGSAAVVGTSTNFLTQLRGDNNPVLSVGDEIQFPGGDNQRYIISAIADDTHLTLTANYQGATASGLSAVNPGGLCCILNDLNGGGGCVVNPGSWVGSAPPNDSLVVMSCPGYVFGPATVLSSGEEGTNIWTHTLGQEQLRQTGFLGDYVHGQHDGARWQWGPYLSNLTNLAGYVGSSWNGGSQPGGITITTGQAGPYGGTNANKIVSSSGTNACTISRGLGGVPTVGDFILFGAWVRSTSGFSLELNAGGVLQCSMNSSPSPALLGGPFTRGTNYVDVYPPIDGDGEWRWVSGWCSVAANPASDAALSISVTAGQPIYVFGPVFAWVPASSMSANQLAILWRHLNSVNGNFPSTTAALQPGIALGLNGHLLTAGTAPAIAASGNLGSGHSVSIAGSDTAGTITVVTGTGSSTGALATVTFATAFGAAPYFVKLEPTNSAAASLLQMYQTIGASSFTVNTNNELADSTTYTWGYMVVGAAS